MTDDRIIDPLAGIEETDELDERLARWRRLIDAVRWENALRIETSTRAGLKDRVQRGRLHLGPLKQRPPRRWSS